MTATLTTAHGCGRVFDMLDSSETLPAFTHRVSDTTGCDDERLPVAMTPEDIRRRTAGAQLRKHLETGVVSVVDEIVHDDEWCEIDDDDVRVQWAERLLRELKTFVYAYDAELARVYGMLDRLGAVAEAAPTAPTPGYDSFRALYADAMLNATDYVVKRGLRTCPGISTNRTQCIDIVDRAAALAARGQTPPLRDVQDVCDNSGAVSISDSAREKPSHYTSAEIETVDKVNAVVHGLPAESAWLLGNVVKYVDRAGKKLDAADDLSKAHDYAHRLVFGDWDQTERK